MSSDLTTLGLEIPPLRDGDRLTREEFERRWDAMPEVKKAELIEGVVYMPPSVSIDHGEPHFGMITWLGLYQMLTPGVKGADNTSIGFDDDNMPQPDALLRVLESHGGCSRVSANRCLEGGLELVAEIANSSLSIDVGVKKEVYRRFGVREYIIWRVPDQAVDWFGLRDGKYANLKPGADGVIKSEVFPGLWLDPTALTTGDSAKLLQVAQSGHASPEHAAFVAMMRNHLSG
jgi:Uma2 family endonuclease